jgi:hypothetical protein
MSDNIKNWIRDWLARLATAPQLEGFQVLPFDSSRESTDHYLSLDTLDNALLPNLVWQIFQSPNRLRFDSSALIAVIELHGIFVVWRETAELAANIEAFERSWKQQPTAQKVQHYVLSAPSQLVPATYESQGRPTRQRGN